jgi:hypothetical protein
LNERNGGEKPELAQYVSVDSLPRYPFAPKDRQFAYDLLGAVAATEPHRGNDAEKHSQGRFVRYPTDEQPNEQRLH